MFHLIISFVNQQPPRGYAIGSRASARRILSRRAATPQMSLTDSRRAKPGFRIPKGSVSPLSPPLMRRSRDRKRVHSRSPPQTRSIAPPVLPLASRETACAYPSPSLYRAPLTRVIVNHSRLIREAALLRDVETENSHLSILIQAGINHAAIAPVARCIRSSISLCQDGYGCTSRCVLDDVRSVPV